MPRRVPGASDMPAIYRTGARGRCVAPRRRRGGRPRVRDARSRDALVGEHEAPHHLMPSRLQAHEVHPGWGRPAGRAPVPVHRERAGGQRSAPALTRTDPAGVIVPPLVAVAVMVRSPMVARPSRNTVRVRLASEPGTIELSHDSRCPSTTIGTPPPLGKLTDSAYVPAPSTPKWTG